MSSVTGPRALRLTGVVLLGALVLRIWHLLLFRQHLDAPWIVTAWLAGAVVVAVVALRLSRIQFAFAVLLAVLVFFFHWGYERAASDGREYFAQAHSLVFDRDLDFTNDNAVLGARGAAKMYPFGLAVLWAPFLLLAQGWLALLNLFGGTHSLDGFTNPYQRAVGIGTLLYGFVGVILIWRVIRDYFSSGLALFAAFTALAGTFALWYLIVENSMSHGVSMFSATLFLYIWHRERIRSKTDPSTAASAWWWIALGLSAGVMTMVRWQNALIAVVPVAIALWEARRRGSLARAAGLLAASGIAGALPQIVFWKIVRGSWISLPAGDHGWDPASLHITEILFSSNHGLFVTTPLAAFAILGLLWMFKRDRTMAIVLFAGLAGQVIANSASGDWWGGPGFGARRFDSCLLAFGLGLAGLITWMRQRPLIAPAMLILVLTGVNAAVMIDVRRGELAASEAVTFTDMTASVYKRVGNPFSFPYSAYIAWKYDADWSLFDRLEGRTFNNIDIDFGDSGDHMFLGNGWLPPYRDGATSFRWASGSTAAIVVPLKVSANYSLEFRCTPFAPPDVGRQTVTVTMNGANVRLVALSPMAESYRIDIPAEVVRAGLNLLRFEFGYAIVPRDVGMGPESRPLAVQFDTLRLRRILGDRP